jgi:hypothetical protein
MHHLPVFETQSFSECIISLHGGSRDRRSPRRSRPASPTRRSSRLLATAEAALLAPTAVARTADLTTTARRRRPTRARRPRPAAEVPRPCPAASPPTLNGSTRVSRGFPCVGNVADSFRGQETNSFSLLLVSCKNYKSADVAPY